MSLQVSAVGIRSAMNEMRGRSQTVSSSSRHLLTGREGRVNWRWLRSRTENNWWTNRFLTDFRSDYTSFSSFWLHDWFCFDTFQRSNVLCVAHLIPTRVHGSSSSSAPPPVQLCHIQHTHICQSWLPVLQSTSVIITAVVYVGRHSDRLEGKINQLSHILVWRKSLKIKNNDNSDNSTITFTSILWSFIIIVALRSRVLLYVTRYTRFFHWNTIMQTEPGLHVRVNSIQWSNNKIRCY